MEKFDLYNTDFISGVMSLRSPQKKSLEILDNILNHIKPTKNMDLDVALAEVQKKYPICTNFERDFMSLSFVLATGVGKTRLMGAFITYLYTQKNIKNFFVVAPNTTIFNKLKEDFGNPSSEKYVFKGLGCFCNAPQIITDDDYRTKSMFLFETDIKIYIYNISKFNSDKTNMRKVNEMLGDSFFEYLSKLEDLVLIMDEAHHYHAEKSSSSLNDLNPILGLELTATPFYNDGSKQVPFKNAVYEYPLSESIKDGYTRTPYALTQQNIDFYNFGEEELDKVMILDGLKNHENIKKELELYSKNNKKRNVKPFVMIVCKDTEHAEKVAEYIKSDACKNGEYKEKTLLIHTKLTKANKDANIQLLLDVEKYDNPIEIVIHVDMLKEGWDVNNLYTIIPLRTASSKILREQMVGRGLRLPFGERTGEKYIDAVMLTAHGKFEDILNEAKKGDSIFNAGNVIYIDEIENTEQELTQISLDFKFEEKEIEEELKNIDIPQTEENKEFVKRTREIMREAMENSISELKTRKETLDHNKVKTFVIKSIKEDKDLAKIYEENESFVSKWLSNQSEKVTLKTMESFIPIPLIQISDDGIEEYKFVDFSLDFSRLNYVPVENKLIVQNLSNQSEREIIQGDSIDFDIDNPAKEILKELKKKSEIDYTKCSELLYTLINEFTDHYTALYQESGLKNIVMMNKRSIANEIHRQMFLEEHFYYSRGLFDEKIIDVTRTNMQIIYDYKNKKNLYDNFEGLIVNTLFTGIEKGVHSSAKFHSLPELKFARLLEQDIDVIRWLRPHKSEFNLFYNRNKRYEPDFVVETENTIYLVEVKGEDKLENADVIAKKERAIQYCKISSEWSKANNYKPWKYLFIPAGEIRSSISFNLLTTRFVEE
ncbi:DEAD/DEAH box helicase family protein [Streptobacillus ratti]|uniref:DEAD/DEAH box helicase family protein n=1 Tax=Streptobacillus ratti TaxID=1720557 RepID=UPI0009344CD7|nr:DEAD/DEAH box helicase family protein [Streptobacillus ratti]